MSRILTGSVDAKADRKATVWAEQNHTRRANRYGLIGGRIIWGTESPIAFAFCIAMVCAILAGAAAAVVCVYGWKIPAPTKVDFDVSAFMGVAWTVQATLLALVYPIVFAFIALLLQRKVHASSLLKVYLLESGIVPAGASSVALLVVMGATYYLSPYYPLALFAHAFAFVILFHALWLMLNVGMTGMFLGRTVRFIHDGQQRSAYVRAAVDIAFRAELKDALKKNILITAPQDEWGFPGIEKDEKTLPLVFNFALSRGPAEVSKNFKRSSVLVDVRLSFLHYVAKRWNKRAIAESTGQQSRRPSLYFPAQFDDVRSERVSLCIIENGPALQCHERWLVWLAYSFRPLAKSGNRLSTKAMLEEFGADVLMAAEQGRFESAEIGMKQLVSLHKTLLRACTLEVDGQYISAATIGIAPGSFCNESFDQTWLQPYRDLSRVAVSYLDEDDRLFRVLSYVSASIVAEVSPTPEQPAINAQLVGTHLFYHLEKWWKKKIDQEFAFDNEKFIGLLPAPARATYDSALLSFIGHWGNLRMYLDKESEKNEVQQWSDIKGRALVYARHIENSAILFVKAVSRQDETAADRLLDHFLKWWGTRDSHLNVRNLPRDTRFVGVNIELTTKSWDELKVDFADANSPMSMELATSIMSLGLKRYWEEVRLYLIAYLLERAGKSPETGNRELRYVAHLFTRIPQFRGGLVRANSLASIDELLDGILLTAFGSSHRSSRIDAFMEEISRLKSEVEVSGWTYSWSGAPLSYEAMPPVHAILLVAAASVRRISLPSCSAFVKRCWDDVDKLAEMERFLHKVRCSILSSSFSENNLVIQQLQGLFNTTLKTRTARRVISTALKNLRKEVVNERTSTLQKLPLDEAKIGRLHAQCAELLFDKSMLPSMVKGLTFSPDVGGLLIASFEHCPRRSLQERIGDEDNSDIAERAADVVRHDVFKELLEKLIRDASLTSFDLDVEDYDVECVESQNFLKAVDAECQKVRLNGGSPIILCGQSAHAYVLDESRWWMNTCSVPAGFSLKRLEDEKRKDFRGTFNGVEIFDFPTPRGACYVVAAAMVEAVVVQHDDGGSALTMELSDVDQNWLNMKFTLVAQFSAQ